MFRKCNNRGSSCSRIHINSSIIQWAVKAILIWCAQAMTMGTLNNYPTLVKVSIVLALGCKRIIVYSNYTKCVIYSELQLFWNLLQEK